MSLIDSAKELVDKVIHPGAHPSAEDLAKETVPQLKARAKEAGIKGYDGMKKAQLIEALLPGAEIDQEKVKKIAAEVKAEKADASSSEKSDYASHPKFDKFKSLQGAE